MLLFKVNNSLIPNYFFRFRKYYIITEWRGDKVWSVHYVSPDWCVLCYPRCRHLLRPQVQEES